METHKRRQAILALLRETGEVQIEDLAPRFGVSGNSIRNDLDKLADEGALVRIRGGAVASAGGILPPHFSTAFRLGANRPEKDAIGRWAAEMVRDNDAIIMDDSSSVLQMAAFLRNRRNLTVVTNGLEVALLLAQEPTNKVILAANTVSSGEASLVGNLNPDLLQGFRASRCFLSCVGFSIEQGLTDTDSDKATVKSQMMRLASQTVALVDHTKFGRVSTFRTAGLSQIDHLVSDQGLSAAQLAELRRTSNFPITLAGATPETLLPLGPGLARRFRIGFGNLSERMVFAQQVRQSLEIAARNAGNIDLLVRDNDLDRHTALNNTDWFVAERVDLVIEYQIDNEAGNVIMDKFQRAGIPVIAVDIPLPGATFFGADNYRAGRMAGEGLGRWLLQHWEGRLDLLLELHTERVGPVGAARLQGQRDGLTAIVGPLSASGPLAGGEPRAAGQTQVVECPVILADVTARVLELLPSIQPAARVAIIAMNDDAATGALNAFERAGRLDQVVAVGQNADLLGRAALRRPGLPFIGSTAYRPERYGDRLIELALRLLRGEAVPPAVYCHHTFISRENLEQYYPTGGAGAPPTMLPSALLARETRAG
jgi:ribose transport system substrate-binding protein